MFRFGGDCVADRYLSAASGNRRALNGCQVNFLRVRPGAGRKYLHGARVAAISFTRATGVAGKVDL